LIYAPKKNFSSIGQAVHEIQSLEKSFFKGLPFLGLFVKNSLKIEGAIFFKAACARIHKTVASTTYLKLSKIGGYRLSNFGRGLRGLAHKTNIEKKASVVFLNP
jgi:hypothetical protein